MKSNMALRALLSLLTATLHAELKPNPLFSDGAVLQRGQKIPVWGSARDGEMVTVEFQGQKATTTGGKWSVHPDPLTEGGPFTMIVSGLGKRPVDIDCPDASQTSPTSMLLTVSVLSPHNAIEEAGNWEETVGKAHQQKLAEWQAVIA